MTNTYIRVATFTMMKLIFKPLFVLLLLATNSSNAQSVFIARHFDNNINKQHTSCPINRAQLELASAAMFEAGNPKYVIVDLIKDGYFSLNDSFSYNIEIDLYEKHNNKFAFALSIPIDQAAIYTKKFQRFAKLHHIPPHKETPYRIGFYNYVTMADIIDENSNFRKNFEKELKRISHYRNYKGDLRLYTELVKDGLVPLDSALKLDFSTNGFYVQGKRLTPAMRHKYMSLCKEEFGNNYYSDHSSLRIGALKENTMRKRIAEYHQKATEY